MIKALGSPGQQVAGTPASGRWGHAQGPRLPAGRWYLIADETTLSFVDVATTLSQAPGGRGRRMNYE